MATGTDNPIEEATLSTIDTRTASMKAKDDRVVMSSGDEIRSTDDDALAQPAPHRTLGRARNSTPIDCIVRVKAGKLAKEAAVGKLLKYSEKLPAEKLPAFYL